MALRRIRKELEHNEDNPSTKYTFGPVGDDLFLSKGTIVGPEHSPYKNGVYEFTMRFPRDYPFKPPKFNFTTKIYHPKINQNGNIHLGIFRDDWTPSLTAAKVCMRVIKLLQDPLPPHCCEINMEAAKHYRQNRKEFCRIAAKYNQQFAAGDPLDKDSIPILYQLQPLTIRQLDECYEILNDSMIFEGDKNLKNIVMRYFGEREEEMKFCSDYDQYIDKINSEKKARQLQKYKNAYAKNKNDPAKMRVIVKTLTGKTITLAMEENDTVHQLKWGIFEHEGLPMEQQRLIFNGLQIEDNRTLSYYHIQSDSVIHLILRLRCSGG